MALNARAVLPNQQQKELLCRNLDGRALVATQGRARMSTMRVPPVRCSLGLRVLRVCVKIRIHPTCVRVMSTKSCEKKQIRS